MNPVSILPKTLTAFADCGQLLAVPGFPIGYLGISWIGPRLGGAVRFRRARGWDPWLPIRVGDSQLGGPRRALIAGAGAVAYQVTPPPNSDQLQIVAINTTDGPGRASTEPSPASDWEQITGAAVVGRAAWGAEESLRFTHDGSEMFPAQRFRTQTLTIHHTATPNGDPDPAATVRAIYFFQTVSQEIGDIGYHLLIDEEGAVYEGRRSIRTPKPASESCAGHSPLTCTGAHVGGYNAGNIGVSLLGNFADTQPTPAARQSLVRILATLADTQRVDPLSQVSYLNPITGAAKFVHAISAHRDWSLTACPGEAFHQQLDSVRHEVAALLTTRRAQEC